MRVTNSMLSSRMMLNINKNMRQVDLLYNQLATTKKVNYPSDNPILASRALKFRSMVHETEQYQRNVAQGLSWMELTDSAFTNIVDILRSVGELSVSGASDQNAYDDRQKIANSIEQYLNQLSTEMNVTYAGRYVFSGYRTDQPATYTQDTPDDDFTIIQNFVGTNIERIKPYQKIGATSEPIAHEDADILKLAYQDLNPATSMSIEIKYTNPPSTQTITPTVRSVETNPAAYKPGDNEIIFIPETGELVLGKNISNGIRGGATLDVTYDKKGFKKGELNPRVYFECIERPAVGPAINWNNIPEYTMDAHKMLIEFGVGSKIEVNSLAKNILTDKLYADLRSLVDLLKRVEVSDEVSLRAAYRTSNPTATDEEIERFVTDQLTREKQRLTEIIQSKYSNMIEIVQKGTSSVSTQQTDLGTRMGRLELISNRLIDDRLSYKKLLSDNEDADIVEVSYLLNEASAVYQASLQAGANVIQLTLANFIR